MMSYLGKWIILLNVLILWLSRNKPLPKQIDILKKKFGNVEIHIYDQFVTVDDFEKFKDYDYIVAVLPPHLLVSLVEMMPGKVLQPVMKVVRICSLEEAEAITDPYSRNYLCHGDKCTVFEAVGFKLLKRVTIEATTF